MRRSAFGVRLIFNRANTSYNCQITRNLMKEEISFTAIFSLRNTSHLSDIGKTMVSNKFPITTDSFWFTLDTDVIVNPFDFVTVGNVRNTKTIGIVKELQTVAIDSHYYHYSLLQDLKEERKEEHKHP